MEISDVIRQDGDRLFILDHDCYVIFTGDTVDDEKPFIRIGNWINLPVEIIPLIENIIVTDHLIGNPSYEQFNIDVNYLPTNRYIGSRPVVKRYLDFQKTFGLDLTNVSVVEIEKDIPQISKEKIISDRDSFIGVFYTNGDFQVTHNRRAIFNLKAPEGRYFDDLRILDTISEIGRESTRYTGCGFVVLQNNPLFYKSRYFTSYHFPRACYEDFARLEIDPAQIRELILPSSNLINITRLARWKHQTHSKLKIFSDHRDDIDLLQKLFTGATITRKDFDGFTFETGDGLSARNYPGTYNVRMLYKKAKPALEDLALAYIKGFAGVQSILGEDLDAIMISYPVYEEANLLFKSTDTPLILIPEQGRPVPKPSPGGPAIAIPGIQYELFKYSDTAELIAEITRHISAKAIVESLASGDVGSITGLLSAGREAGAGSRFDSTRDAVNTLALLKIYRNTTTDRKFSSALQKLMDSLRSLADPAGVVSDDSPRFRISMALCDGSLYEYMEELPGGPGAFIVLDEVPEESPADLDRIADPALRRHYETIIADRRRLRDLLSLFAGNMKDDSRIRELRAAIALKKEQYEFESLGQRNDAERADAERERRKIMLKKALVPLAVLALAGLAALAYRFGAPVYHERQRAAIEERRALKDAEQKRLREELIKKYEISVSDHDIFVYVNQVALKNGYAPIPYASMKNRNPNWIYPGNVFVMLDGERMVVKEGDTLWKMSYTRLQDRGIAFHRTLEEIEKSAGRGLDIAPLVEKARSLAVNGGHAHKLEALLSKLGK
ncbi:MAG: hypothetical protein MUC76_03165 [Spirochaetes bacterium]|jgi:hypothetical protein|nr:hypothetical protein [Spirochaetota bacterium]